MHSWAGIGCTRNWVIRIHADQFHHLHQLQLQRKCNRSKMTRPFQSLGLSPWAYWVNPVLWWTLRRIARYCGIYSRVLLRVKATVLRSIHQNTGFTQYGLKLNDWAIHLCNNSHYKSALITRHFHKNQKYTICAHDPTTRHADRWSNCLQILRSKKLV